MKFTLRGTRYNVGYETVAALTTALLLDRSGRIGLCILAAFWHETGHLLMMRVCRCPVREVRVRLFDVLILADRAGDSQKDLLITAAGAGFNLLAAALCALPLPHLATANLVIGVFNLLPVESLDGGRIVGLLLMRRLTPDTCVRAVRICSFVFLVPFFLLGITALLTTGYNYSLLAISLYLLAVLLIR